MLLCGMAACLSCSQSISLCKSRKTTAGEKENTYRKGANGIVRRPHELSLLAVVADAGEKALFMVARVCVLSAHMEHSNRIAEYEAIFIYIFIYCENTSIKLKRIDAILSHEVLSPSVHIPIYC